MPEDLVQGWTEPIDQILKADGVAINGTGLDLTLELRDQKGGVVNVTGKVTWLSAATGVARFTPADGDIVYTKSPYRARWRVSTGGTAVVYFPNREADIWTVRQ